MMLTRSNRLHGWLLLAVCLVRALGWSQGTNEPAGTVLPEDDYDIGLGLFSLGLILLALLIVGIGAVVSVVALGIGAGLFATGILSSSVLIGVVRRSPSSAMRALTLQLGAWGGLFAGLTAGWLGLLVSRSDISLSAWLIVGGAMGVVIGGAVAWVFNLAWCRALVWFRGRSRGMKERNEIPKP